jgi:MmyB-like transcription regulator ligand binding domain
MPLPGLRRERGIQARVREIRRQVRERRVGDLRDDLELLARGQPKPLGLNVFGPLRPFIVNWDEAAEVLLQRVHREAVGGVPDARTTALLEEPLAFHGVPPAWRVPDLGRPLLPVVPVRFRRDGRTFSYFSAVTTLGTAQNALLQEIRVESLCPADEATASAAPGAGSRSPAGTSGD